MQAVEVVGLLVLVSCGFLLGLVLRRRWLDRSGGTLEMSLRSRGEGRPAHPSLGWSFGVARYEGDRLLWFKTFSASPRPQHVLARSDLVVRARREPHGAEALAVIADAVVVECGCGTRSFDLALPSEALPGFLAWIEAAPRRSVA